MSASTIVEILQIGVIGLGFLLALMAYRLLGREMRLKEPRPTIIRAIYVFMSFSLALGLIGLASQFLPQGETIGSENTNSLSVESSALRENIIHLSAGSMTLIPDLNIGVKLSTDYKFEKSTRQVRLSFSFPKRPDRTITEENKVDESIVSIQGHWIRLDIEQVISLGELGKFAVSVSDYAFTDDHEYVTSLQLSIASAER